METPGTAVLLGVPAAGEVTLPGLGFHGTYVSSPSGQWLLAVERLPPSRVARWVLLHDNVVRSTGATGAHVVSAMAVADDATFVLARSSGKSESRIDVREADGSLLLSQEIEAVATSSVISSSGRWVAVGCVEAKRGDDPVLLIDADGRRLYRRIPAKGSTVRFVDEERRLIITDDGELPFGRAPPPPVRPEEPPAPAWRPNLWAGPPPPLGGPPPPWWMNRTIRLVLGMLFVLICWRLVFASIVTTTPLALIRQYEQAGRSGSLGDVCHAADQVAQFYLRTHNDSEYARWKVVEQKDCAPLHKSR